MTDPLELTAGVSAELWAGILTAQVYDDDAGVSVQPPKRFTDDGDTYVRLSIHAENDWPDDDGPHDGTVQTGVALTRTQAREVGDYLRAVADAEPETVFSEE